jgi:hypothetical protein
MRCGETSTPASPTAQPIMRVTATPAGTPPAPRTPWWRARPRRGTE